MAQNFKSADDISKIIKTCSECGVVEIKIGSLEIKFSPYFQTVPKVSYTVEETSELPNSIPEAESPKPNPAPLEVDDDFDLFNDPVSWDRRARGNQGADEP